MGLVVNIEAQQQLGERLHRCCCKGDFD